MTFTVYIIDDAPTKTSVLPTFLGWLKTSFPAHTFNTGFSKPNEASSNPKKIQEALNDPAGVILLDAWMNGKNHIDAHTEVLRKNLIDQTEFNKVSLTLHDTEETKLASAIYCAARQRNARLIWISNQTIERNLAQDIESLSAVVPNLAWYEEGDRGTWDHRHIAKVAIALRPFHEDPVLNDAIVFAVSPPKGDGHWMHDPLVEGESHNILLANWLALKEVDGESCKALLLGKCAKDPWAVCRPVRPARTIDVSVLKAVCKKLSIVLDISAFRARDPIPVPCSPLLPFVMSLRAMLFQMSICEKYHAPKSVILEKNGSRYFIRLPLELNRKDNPRKVIDLNAFQKAYDRAKSAFIAADSFSTPIEHLTTARMADLIHARVTLSHTICGSSRVFFSGTSEEIASIEFGNGSKQKAISITWPIKTK